MVHSGFCHNAVEDCIPIRHLEGKVGANGCTVDLLPVHGSDCDAGRPQRELIPYLKLPWDEGLGAPMGSVHLSGGRPHLDVACPNNVAVAPLFNIAIHSGFCYGSAKDLIPIRHLKGEVGANGCVIVMLPVRGSDRDTGRSRSKLVPSLKLTRQPGLGASTISTR